MKWLLIVLGVVVVLVAVVVIVGACLPKAHVASRSARFKAPLKTVWDVVTAFAEQKSWRADLITIERQPDRNGHDVWRETMKNSPPLDFETTQLVAGKRLVRKIVTQNIPFGGEWVMEFTGDGGGTTLTITENGEVYNPVFRFVARFIMGHTATLEAYLKSLGQKLGEEITLG